MNDETRDEQGLSRPGSFVRCLTMALALPLLACTSGRTALEPEAKMEKVGQTFLFDYGDLVIEVRYLTDRTLAWEQVKGPDKGLKAEEQYQSWRIRPDVYFVWWQEKDTSVVTQVVDFEKGLVHTTWTSPEKKVASFQGTIRSGGP